MDLLEVDNLHTYFDTKRGTVKAVKGVTFSLKRGKTLGIVGESGSGKSQTAMSILQLFQRNQYIAEGQIRFDGKNILELSKKELLKIRGNDISMIFQEPMTSLNPVFTIKAQLTEALKLHQHVDNKTATLRAYELLETVKITDPKRVAKQYPHQLSGGMSQRVMIAMALACNPKLLIADEPTTALDVIIQAEILKLMNELKDKLDTSILFITHDLGVISKMADDVIVMHGGKIVESAPINEIFKNAYHPYTRRLLAAFLRTDIRNKKTAPDDFYSKENNVFDFTTFKTEETADPDWVQVGTNHFVAASLRKIDN
ncbi:ABC transporter ATP-binding protein [Enterococcus casseliflavus]|uniref:ABC transporter ATP-binding protein n=1 Tax=Enterococcus casseliflavus TaxID=37734 RepID=UPI00232AED30|nr:ABC transporter ATP-binding protein [Enterococcus casseliflavus]MDB1696603.1 ABC transporter ATP-binding protein [Enterococcus casseliflavus]MDB1699906.1 ABC transporter ATP-binding protein [Enterococcus casseliflavus]MDB1706768.1 ABC transporter ATP-binding protein [Enterococcus casseliflavus]